MLKACIKRAEITPPLGLTLEGYPHYPRYNEGAHDPLYATCLYLENGGTEIALVALDLLFFSKQHVLAVRERAAATCGINGKNIMISCTHTHSGPCASSPWDLESIEAGVKQPIEYVESVITAIVQLIKKAKEDAFPASLGSGKIICAAESGIGGNRRFYGGPHDPFVSVIAIKDEADTVRGAMVNYSLHPTFIHEWSNVCTADYPCYLKKEIEEKYEGAIAGFLQGTSGNQSSRYYRQGESYDEAERVGRTLGRAAIRAIEKLAWEKDPALAVVSDTVPLSMRDFGTEEEARAQIATDRARYEELYAKYGTSENREEYYLWQNANLKLLGSEHKLDFVLLKKKGIKVNFYDEEAPAEVQLIRLGDACIVGFPGELFVEYGIFIKGMLKFSTVFINTVSNGCLPGYVYTPESLVTGGYEADTSLLPETFGKSLVDKAIELSQKLYQ